MRGIARRLALRLGVVGLMNIQFALHEGQVYVLEVNPRASRTVPFIAKAVGRPLVAIACRLMAGQTLQENDFTEEPPVPGVFVKAPVFPFRRFPGVDPVLGPEMKSTGEVMGHSSDFGTAFAKAWLGAGHRLPLEGAAFLSVHDRDKAALVPVAQAAAPSSVSSSWRPRARSSSSPATASRCDRCSRCRRVRPHIVDLLIDRQIDLVVNTPLGRESQQDDALIRRTALRHDIPCITTLSGALACAEGIAALRRGTFDVRALQELHRAATVPGSAVGASR